MPLLWTYDYLLFDVFSLESQFTDAMKNLLDGAAGKAKPFNCPNCNQQRCPCHECSISHLITCGLLAPDLQVKYSSTPTPISLIDCINNRTICIQGVERPSNC